MIAPLASRESLPERLQGDGPDRERAERELHALLLRAARFEIARRPGALAHVRGETADDLAEQAAADAFVAVMAKLDEFGGRSRFTTWAYKFALYETSVRLRRRAWQHREVVIDADGWLAMTAGGSSPGEQVERAELLAAIKRLVATKLTPHQRDVLVALAVRGVPIDVLAERLGSTRGALYKSLHDARRKLRAELEREGHDLGGGAAC